jgi:hypothetical protein
MGRLDCLERGAADQAVKMADMNWGTFKRGDHSRRTALAELVSLLRARPPVERLKISPPIAVEQTSPPIGRPGPVAQGLDRGFQVASKT